MSFFIKIEGRLLNIRIFYSWENKTEALKILDPWDKIPLLKNFSVGFGFNLKKGNYGIEQ
jgi:hypothetical protein